MRIAMGSDHVGLDLKEHLTRHLGARGVEVVDLGCRGHRRCDYPVFGTAVARAVTSGEADLGVLACGTGVGISIAANKVGRARACACSDTYSARLSRQHNDANIIAMGAMVVGPGLAEQIVDAWLDASFEGGRHGRRVAMLDGRTTTLA
ncbi:ribose 5-phosphate isomerase B [Granulimonas faecalis]|uniref:ribose 5-phosphate isomerase B n=1 Tax=Granulimonas faecalis TaxID=2894155 RepID=UPI003510DA94